MPPPPANTYDTVKTFNESAIQKETKAVGIKNQAKNNASLVNLSQEKPFDATGINGQKPKTYRDSAESLVPVIIADQPPSLYKEQGGVFSTLEKESGRTDNDNNPNKGGVSSTLEKEIGGTDNDNNPKQGQGWTNIQLISNPRSGFLSPDYNPLNPEHVRQQKLMDEGVKSRHDGQRPTNLFQLRKLLNIESD
jgi:hypothetical protein